MEFFAEHSLYVVLLIALVVWGGIYAYLVRVDGKVKKLEDQLHQ
jgi:CcmD family protein